MKKQNRYHIGISLGFNSSAACVDNKGRLLRAVSEERLNRQKNTKIIPVRAINYVKPHEEEQFYLSTTLTYSHYDTLDKSYFEKYEPQWKYIEGVSPELNLLYLINLKCSLSFNNIIRVDHHTAHAYSVFPYYKVPNNSCIITSDGYGDDLSQTERYSSNMKAVRGRYNIPDSLALVYQFVTGSLGLKMHQHEGKVTGLAAYGCPRLAATMLDSFYAHLSLSMYYYKSKYNSFNELKEAVFKFCEKELKLIPEDVKINVEDKNITSLCLMVQWFIEREMLRRLDNIQNQHKYHLFLAGGLFANVRLNSLIADKTKFKSVNIAPPMGDEGTAVGAVLSLFTKQTKGKFENVFSAVDMNDTYGIQYDKERFERETIKVYYTNEKYLVNKMAQMLADGEIVHYRNDISEFGPRALCHSTTFYQPSDPDGTKLLNRTLGRSEYMPYAPIILDCDVKKLFIRNKKLDRTNQYMTAILKFTGNVKDYAGAVHIDSTARPQILYNKKSFAYKLLKQYKKLTGKMMLINTSWNIHGNPTVATVNDSFLTWMESGYCGGALVHGLTMYTKKGPEHG